MSGKRPQGKRQVAPLGFWDSASGWLIAGARLLQNLTAGGALAFWPSLAHAQVLTEIGPPYNTVEVIQAAIVIGAVGSALFCAIYLIRERARMASQIQTLKAELRDTNAAFMRAESLVNLRDQRIVVWSDADEKPRLLGSLPAESGAPEDRAHFLAFGRWLTPRSAGAIDHAAAGLREHGRSFDLMVETQKGAPIEVQGRKNATHAFMRFVSLSETQRSQARLTLDNQRLSSDMENVMGLLAGVEMPVWIRGSDGRLRWVNQAYARAVEIESPQMALAESAELFGTTAREDMMRHHAREPLFSGPVTTVVGGDRHVFKVTEASGDGASVGLAIDATKLEAVREQQVRMSRSHADTLDQLTTAVATFDAKQKLRFYNQAFQKLWQLDANFLDSAPDNTLLLDRLRSEGKIAEQPEWRRWKETILSTYRAVEPQEHSWHLPDRRTIRVVANPQPDGGVTWVYENLTQMIDLERDLTTAVKVQGETLDNLAEGVILFGVDGRIRLFNPAFLRLWGLTDGEAVANLHIAELRARCDRAAVDSPWPEFVEAVTGFNDERRDLHGNAAMKNGSVVRYAVIHLPNGQVMMTFVDVTDSVNVERALKDKNDALRRADQIKNRFLQHVSYELRSPLTNIIGFTELLTLTGADPLTARQQEYVGHIGTSSSILLTVVNDILDLATVDAGVMQLEIADMSIDRMIGAAAETVADRLEESQVTLRVDVEEAPEVMRGDENRIRQVLANLLANAANFAPPKSIVRLTCRRVDAGVEFIVHDDGPGMPQEMVDQIFEPFESRTNGGRRRGAGLGLAIVSSFVQLHGGTVRVATAAGKGTTVTCFFPDDAPVPPSGLKEAAE